MITYFVIFILALVAFVCLLWFLPSKGKAGEMRVAKILSKLPEEEYRVINNLLIKQGNKTTQIDHVVVSEYRIFVIETKHYRGWIYGDANREYWTQNIYGNKYDLWNPIHQNQGHIRALRRVLTDIPPGVFISIVTFSRQASLDIRNSENVIYWDELKKLICSYQRKLISTEQAQNAYETLLTANIDSKDNQKNTSVTCGSKFLKGRKLSQRDVVPDVVENWFCERGLTVHFMAAVIVLGASLHINFRSGYWLCERGKQLWEHS